LLRLHDDQAAGLRRLFRRSAPTVVAVVGGHAGSGATRIACALAQELAARGMTTTLVDEHRSRRNAASMLGVRFRYDMWQVLNGDVPLARAAVAVNDRLTFMSAARLAQHREHLDEARRGGLESHWKRLNADSEAVVIDASVHADGKFSPLAAKAGVIAVVTGGTSAAVMGSYLMLKSIAQARRAVRLGVVVNRAADARQAASIGDNMRCLIKRQLGRSVELFGFSPVVSEWLAGTMPNGNAGVEFAGLLSALNVSSRHENCTKNDKGNFIETVADGFACAAAVAT
jgi:flagellar biosynthesis protein FlhG